MVRGGRDRKMGEGEGTRSEEKVCLHECDVRVIIVMWRPGVVRGGGEQRDRMQIYRSSAREGEEKDSTTHPARARHNR